MENRLIHAFIYMIAGFILGVCVAMNWGFYINTQTSSLMIILITTIICTLFGFVFPHAIQHWFKICWNLFK